MSGIIPARAGFTRRGGGRVGGHRDHPRSRGVYHADGRRVEGLDGSSPLARGLLGDHLYRRLPVRIIPARAGFTPTTPWRAGSDRDHPRSRGVYGIRPASSASSRGSSPLARGLLGVDGLGLPHGRIIPARAGFTSDGDSTPSGASDHPRSRGVYARSATTSSRSTGSSPLARGLQTDGSVRGLPERIIPARAGFTPEHVPLR